MKKIFLKMWYLGWISQYNNKYSGKSLQKLLAKVKSNIDNRVYSKIDISDSLYLYYDSIFELLLMYDIYINGYKDFQVFNPRPYLRQLKRKMNALDYFTLDNREYKSPVQSMEALVSKVEKVFSLFEEENNSSIRDAKIRYIEPLLIDTYVVMEYYFVKLIDGEEIKEKF